MQIWLEDKIWKRNPAISLSADYFLSARDFGVFTTHTKTIQFIFFFSDYVYFETSSTSPYLIRRIEELNKVGEIYDFHLHFCCCFILLDSFRTRCSADLQLRTRSIVFLFSVSMLGRLLIWTTHLFQTPNGNVEAKVMCFYRRRDISNSLIVLADKHHSKFFLSS